MVLLSSMHLSMNQPIIAVLCAIIVALLLQESLVLAHENSVSRCCAFIQQPNELQTCVHAVTESMSDANSKLEIVSFSTDDIKKYSIYAHAVNAFYAEKNHHSIDFFDPSNYADYDRIDTRWTKVKLLLDGVSNSSGSQTNNTEFLMWIDADAVFLDMNLRLEQYFISKPHVQIVLSAESTGSRTMVNTGTILVRKSKWTEDFLREWWGSDEDRKHLSDQERFDKVYHTRRNATSTAVEMSSDSNGSGSRGGGEVTSVTSAVLILPPDGLNSDPPAKFTHLPHHPVLHLMGESAAYREHVFRAALTNICDSLSSAGHCAAGMECGKGDIGVNYSALLGGIPAQLGLTQSKLLEWSLDIYSKLYEEEYAGFMEGVHAGNKTLAECSSLANSAKHYTETLSMMETLASAQGSSRDGEVPQERVQEVVDIRKLVYDAIYINFEAHKPVFYQYRNETGRVLQYWPEMIRNVVSVAQPLMLVSQGMTIPEKLAVAKVCLDLLYELSDMVQPEQQEIVYHTVALHYKDMGMIYLDGNDFPNAIRSLELSLSMLKELVGLSGEHVLLSTLTALGTAYAATERFDDSLDMFHQAAVIAESHLGSWHDIVMEVHLNHAVAAHISGRYDTAERSAAQAYKILLHNNRVQNFDHLKTAEAILADIASKQRSDGKGLKDKDSSRRGRANFMQ